jgi:2-aminoethylphosphonate aminotransferase|tara:strand:- start:2226 stop:3356 length:1131 start_codon:yes stop_codon:yes gene_type:complete
MHKDIERKILLNPGPATTTDTVKMAQVVPDICPREEEFSELMAGIRDDLLKIVNVDKKKYTTVLFGGSGTAVMESVIASVVNQEKTLLILKNGAYGDRMQKIVETYSIPFTTLEYEWGKPINLSEVDSYLKSNRNIGYIAMVHHETTSGILNSIENFSELGKNYGHTLILDAISSYAGISIDLKKTPIDFLMSTSNKCIQGMAGLAFSICKKSELKHLKDIPNRSFYLSLYDQYNYMEKTGQMRFTPPVQTIYALRQAIDEYFDEGSLNRYNRYTENWKRLREGLQKLGFNLLLDPENESHILLTVVEPKNPEYNFDKIHNLLYDKGFTIYPGKLGKKKTFRLANMGAINSIDIDRFINELSNVIIKIGIDRISYK